MNSLQVLLEESIRELYFGEQQFIKMIPETARYVSLPRLQEVLMTHLMETEHQFRRLETIVGQLDINLTGKRCRAMEGLVHQGRAAIKEAARGCAADVAVIGAIQGIGHYEIACCGVAWSMAETLEQWEVALLLQQTLDEEARAGRSFARVAEEEILARGGTACRTTRETERRWPVRVAGGKMLLPSYPSHAQDWI